MTLPTGLRGTNGQYAAPPYNNGPYTWDQNLTLSGTNTHSGSNTFSGAVTFSSTINFTGTTVDFGTYSSMISAPSDQTTELFSVGLTGAEDDFYIGQGLYVRATGEDGKPLGYTATIETTDTTGIAKMQAGQFISLLGTSGGSESAVLKTLGGDSTAGMYGVWAKVGANSNCTTNSGSRVAAIWADNQMSGTVNGEEYGIFATTGASKPKAFVGFETTSSGWENLFYFDETMDTPVEPLASATITGGTQDTYLKVDINGTAYGIPLYTGW